MTESFENIPLRMVVAVRQHQPHHQAEKQRMTRGVNRIFYILIWGVLVYYAGAMALFLLRGSYYGPTDRDTVSRLLLCFLGLFVGVGLCVFAQVRYNTRSAREKEMHYRAALESEPEQRILEVYDDRIEVILPYGTSVFPFCQVEQMLCTGSMLILCVPGGDLVVRSEDLTPFDAQTLFTLLNRMLPADRVRCKKPLTGHLYQPLPLPDPPTVLPAAQFTATVHRRPPTAKGFGSLWLWLVGISLIAASVLVQEIPVFGEPAADFWVLLAMALAGVSAAWGLLSLLNNRPKQTLFVALLENGLVVVDRGITHFYSKKHISVRKKQNGVEITFPGEHVFIDWKDIRSASAEPML